MKIQHDHHTSRSEMCIRDRLKSVDLITRQEVNIDGETYQPGRYHLEIVSDLIKVVIYK